MSNSHTNQQLTKSRRTTHILTWRSKIMPNCILSEYFEDHALALQEYNILKSNGFTVNIE